MKRDCIRNICQSLQEFLFEWFDGDESHFRIYTRMKRFIIRMKLYEQFLEYDRDIVKKVFNGK